MASSFPLKKNTATTIVFPILDADGDLVTGATALDSEYSLDGGAFTDCAAEASEIGASGVYSLALAAGETNGDVVCIQVKTTSSGAKTTVLVFFTAAQTLDDTDIVADAIKAKTDNLPTDPADDSDLDAQLATIDAVVDAIKLKTDIIGATVALESAGNVAAIKAVTDLLPNAGALSDLATIKSEVQHATYGLAAIETLVDDLESRLTATRAGYLDNLSAGAVALESGGNLATILSELQSATYGLAVLEGLVDDLESRLTAARAGYLDELSALNIPADIDTLLARLTALRAGYLDNLSAGAVALEATLTTMKQKAAGTYNRETDSLEALGEATAPSAAVIADAVWDEALADHQAVGSTGEALEAANELDLIAE